LKEKFAIKSVPREASEDYIRQLEKEFRILKEVDHPNIIKFFETYQDQKYFHFVIEYCEGGELFDVITRKGHLYENDAATIIRKL
jgi:serine/threonine protein kinase